jgi:hypothetical protein
VKAQVLNTTIRDFGSTLCGLGILIHQTVIAKEPHAILLLTAMVLLSVPGTIGLMSLWLNGKSTESGIPSRGSHSQLSPSSSPSSGGDSDG